MTMILRTVHTTYVSPYSEVCSSILNHAKPPFKRCAWMWPRCFNISRIFHITVHKFPVLLLCFPSLIANFRFSCGVTQSTITFSGGMQKFFKRNAPPNCALSFDKTLRNKWRRIFKKSKSNLRKHKVGWCFSPAEDALKPYILCQAKFRCYLTSSRTVNILS